MNGWANGKNLVHPDTCKIKVEIIVNTNSNNLEPEFDVRLKAHIKTHAVTTECAGFDFDTASAYLEHTLQARASTLYEEHLADCATCRNQVVELSRLMPAANVVAPAIVPIRAKWREWFSGWKLGMLAGLGTATTAILLFTMVTVQRKSEQLAVAQSKEVAAPSMAVPLANDNFIELKETAKQEDAKTANPAPSASVMAAAPAVQGAAAKAAAPEMEVAKKPVQLDGANAKENAPQGTPAPVVIAPSVAVADSKDASQTLPQGQLQNSQWLPRALPTPTPHGPSFSQNQMQNTQVVTSGVSPKPMAKAAESLAKSEERQAEKIKERAKSADAEKAERDDRAEKSATSAAAGASVGRAAKSAPLKNVAGKNFRFENNRWVDTQLSSGMPEIRLKRNSDEYKKVLKETPELKPYFDLKSVTVVWQGKAYRVE